MKLADQIEVMRKRMVEEHQFAMNAVEHLEKRLVADDDELLRRLDDIKGLQAANALRVAQDLLTIANRIGFLPSPTPAQLKPAVHQAYTPPPLPVHAADQEVDRIVSEAAAVH